MPLALVVVASCLGGPDALRETSVGAQDLADYVDPQGLQAALATYATSATDPATAGAGSSWNRALMDATRRAMRGLDEGAYDDPADVDLLRTKVVPLAATLEKGRMIAEAFDSTCGGDAGGEVMPYVVQASALSAPRQAPWEGDSAAGVEQLFTAPQADLSRAMEARDCSESTFAIEVVRESLEQAFANHVQIRATLLTGDVEWMASDPAGFADAEVALLPAELSTFRENARVSIEQAARAVGEALDAQTAYELRRRTIDGFDAVLQDIQTGFDSASRSNELLWALPGAGERWCQQTLRSYASRNILALSGTVEAGLCNRRGNGTYRPNRSYRPGDSDMGRVAADLEASVAAYFTKLATAWTRGWGRNDPWTTIYHAAYNNVAGVAAAIASRPGCAFRACDFLARLKAQRQRERETDNLVMWGVAAVGIVAVVSGVGVFAVGALAAGGLIGVGAAAATVTVLGAVASAASVVGLIVSLVAVPYLAVRGVALHFWATQDMAALLVSGADPSVVRADRDRAEELIREAVINGVFAVVEVAQVVRALRVRRLGLRGEVELDAARQKLGRAGGVGDDAQKFLDARNQATPAEIAGWVDDLAAEANTSARRVAELASDAAHGGKVRPKSVREARASLWAEREGLLPGPVVRSPRAKADVTDALGQDWDVKGFVSWDGSTATRLEQIAGEIAQSENVIVDTINLTRADARALAMGVEARGWTGKVIFYPNVAMPNPGIGGLLIALTARAAGGVPGGAGAETPGGGASFDDPDGGASFDDPDGGPGAGDGGGWGEDPADDPGLACDDTCTWAFDGVCDDGRPGAESSACDPGTDCTDCEDDTPDPPDEPAAPECEDSCAWSADGYCDDGRAGADSDYCDAGTDCSDCGPVDDPDVGGTCEDTCDDASDGYCDDGGPGSDSSYCDYGTDCTDCGAR